MAKSTKIIAALGVAGALGVAAMPLASYAAASDITSVVDGIKVEVEETCSFKGEVLRTDDGHTTEYGKVFTASVMNGNEADFDGNEGNGVTPAVHEFTVACNRNSGYTVKANATGLTSANGSIAYAKTSDYKTSGNDGTWNVNITKPEGSPVVLGDQITAADTDTTIITTSPTTANAGDKFVATYKVYVGEKTPAGSYAGSVTYTIGAAI